MASEIFTLLTIVCLWLSPLPSTHGAVPREEFVEHGTVFGDSFLNAGDDGYSEIQLRYPFRFSGRSYAKLFVNMNGVLSFTQAITAFTPTCNPLATNIPMVAPFWGDVDTTHGGNVLFRESVDRSTVRVITNMVALQFPSVKQTPLNWAFIATWLDAPFYGEINFCNVTDPNLRNTFQVVLGSDGYSSYAIFNYESITWTTGVATQSGGNCSGTGGTPAKAGIDPGDGSLYFGVPFSCLPEVINAEDNSNIPVPVPGKYIFALNNEPPSNPCAVAKVGAFRSQILKTLPSLKVTPSFVSVLGHIPIKIEGPCLAGLPMEGSITCDFLHPYSGLSRVIPGKIADLANNMFTCLVPYLDLLERTKLVVKINRNGVVEQYFGIIYGMEPQSNSKVLSVSWTGNVPGNVEIRLKWDSKYFGVESVLLSLVLIENSWINWLDSVILVQDMPNTGSYTGTVNLGVTDLSRAYAFKLTYSPTVIDPNDPAKATDKSLFSELTYMGPTDPASAVTACQTWYEADPGFPGTDLLPCPPTDTQAEIDERFEPEPHETLSYRQRIQSPSGGGQQCVYGDPDGFISTAIPGAGSADAGSPVSPFGYVRHFINDTIPFRSCCTYPADSDGGASCRKYYERRPFNTGNDYRPPKSAIAGGDPHITTFDLLAYTFNGVGEFWMIKSAVFSMQGRMVQYIMANGTLAPASIFSAFVMSQPASAEINETRVQISVALSGLHIYINGEAVTFDEPGNFIFDSVSLTIENPSRITISFSLGVSFIFTTADENSALNVITMAVPSLHGQFNGLFGHFDGDSSNDLRAPDGSTIPATSTIETIHNDFGLFWMIPTAAESLFIYPLGRTFADFQNPGFVPNFQTPDPSTFPSEVVAMCGTSNNCLYDYGTTGSILLANDTKTSETEFNAIVESLSKVIEMCPPLVSPEHGYFTANNTVVGAVATFACDLNYRLIGRRTLTCIRRGPNRPPAWNGRPPTCRSCYNRSKGGDPRVCHPDRMYERTN